jgi:hypothetical protein
VYKGRAHEQRALKACWSGGEAPRILNLRTRWGGMVSFMLQWLCLLQRTYVINFNVTAIRLLIIILHNFRVIGPVMRYCQCRCVVREVILVTVG